MLYTMDGNDSLRRILRRSTSQDDDGTLGPSSELPSTRNVPGDRYLSREDVNKWADGVLQEMMDENTDSVRNSVISSSAFTNSLFQTDPDYNPCADRWKNMKTEITKKMWGIFDETGIFLALCRHGFSLVIADMVQSGEL